ncbi:MAG: hypothetical protein ACN4GZ_02075 [Acidimicrobiales bacterium]
MTLVLCVGAGCGSTQTSAEQQAAVETYVSGSPVQMQVGLTRLQLTESGVLVLNSIGDGRCPADAACVWEGEVAGFFGVGSLEEMNKGVETDGLIRGFTDGERAPAHSLSGSPKVVFELDDIRYELVVTDLIVNQSDELVGLEIVVTTL